MASTSNRAPSEEGGWWVLLFPGLGDKFLIGVTTVTVVWETLCSRKGSRQFYFWPGLIFCF